VDINAINFNRPPPFALRYQRTSPAEGGHAGSEVCGVIEKVMRDGNVIISEGRLDLSPEGGKTAGDEVERLAFAGMLQTWSPDLADATIDLEENALDEDGSSPQETIAHFVEATYNGGTVVAQPALASAVFELLDDEGNILVPAPSRETIATQAIGDSTDPEEQKMITERTDGPAFAEEVELIADQTAEQIEDELWSLSMLMTIDELAARNFPTKARKKYADKGVARPDGSFPIPDADALRRAVQSIGRAKPEDRAAIRAHIRKRAKALGVPVPEGAKETKTAASIVACAGPAAAPSEWFTEPTEEMGRWVTVTADGRIYGLAGTREECHIGYMDRCVTIDMIADGIEEGCNFEYAMPGHVVTAEGTKIGTGPIAIKGGHAQKGLGWREALAHYDDPDAAVADVVYGRTKNGDIWFSGALRPDANENKVHALRASGVSLDAREIGGKLRYLATCSVNTPGFPKAGVRLVASGEESDADEILSMVAIGGAPISAYDMDDTCSCGHTEEVEEELERIRNVISASGIEELALERMSDDVLATLTLDE
jgi:hypothetical protein